MITILSDKIKRTWFLASFTIQNKGFVAYLIEHVLKKYSSSHQEAKVCFMFHWAAQITSKRTFRREEKVPRLADKSESRREKKAPQKAEMKSDVLRFSFCLAEFGTENLFVEK